MRLSLTGDAANEYKSGPQRIRVMSENWGVRNLTCTYCGSALTRSPNNAPVCDLICASCPEQYELKFTRSPLTTINDGAYDTMISRLADGNNPNLFVARYAPQNMSIQELLIIPKFFFTPGVILKRKPLSATARRAGWVGCVIDLKRIPQRGKIRLVANGVPLSAPETRKAWNAALPLAASRNLNARGWLLAVLACVERLNKRDFTLRELYAFDADLQELFPGNQHVREKIRQQVQRLRDMGVLEFSARGAYRVIT